MEIYDQLEINNRYHVIPDNRYIDRLTVENMINNSYNLCIGLMVKIVVEMTDLE